MKALALQSVSEWCCMPGFRAHFIVPACLTIVSASLLGAWLLVCLLLTMSCLSVVLHAMYLVYAKTFCDRA